MKNGQFPAVLNLTDLNGQNGFKLDGENNNDNSGGSVGAAGDINGDGHDDLVIGAYGYPSNSGKGRSYVVFGGPGVGGSGDILLSSLNGANGFKLDGENNNDNSGGSVGAAGDINGDGHDDLVIGAYGYPSNTDKGRSYVVFGGPGVGQSGDLMLSSLNGTNGFKLDGENNNDYSGWSVRAVGDINGDGHDDLVIGAVEYLSGSAKGRSYVVFGGPGVSKSGGLLLSSLNGANGFKLDSENNADYGSGSVSAAGDINGDGHDDLLIGAYGYPSNNFKGRSYVVFGGPGVGQSGDLLLSSLNGTNGFKLDGENNNDRSGVSVSAAGDINGDGYNDLLIGAYEYPSGSGKGRSYVVFGGPGVGGSGNILLSSLNGANGFKLDGENNNDQSGLSVSAAGDINGDGYTDLLIGAYGYPSNTDKGRSYVVFGGPGVGGSGNILLSSLNGANGFKLDGENNNDDSGAPVSAAGDINGDSVDDVLIGAHGYPGGANKGRSYVVFGDVPPVLVNNSLSIGVGGTIAVNSSNLGAYDRNHNNQSLLFVFTGLQHGFFALRSTPITPVVNVTQAQVRNGTVTFSHDGSAFAPSYNVTVRSTGIAWTGPIPANITFIPVPTTTPVFSTTTSPSATPSMPTLSLSPSPSGTPTPTSTILPTTTTSGSTPTPTPSPMTLNPTTTIMPPITPTPTLTPTLTPTSNFTPPFSTAPSSDDHSILPILIGAAVGGLAAFAALCGGAWYYRRKKQGASKTLVTETPKDSKLFSPVQSAAKRTSSRDVEDYSTPGNISPVSMELASISQHQLPLPPPASISEHQPGKADPESFSELKISSRSQISHVSSQLIDDVGDMKISLSIAYQDLEFDEKDKLGSGAYGTVYKGTYKFNDVAIKQLHAQQLSAAAVDELKLEAGILGSMRSNYIVQLQGICLEAPHFCLVMELMPKGSLYSVLQNSPELPLSVRYQIGLDVCYGLYHLHEKDILHRDLKSLNVLLDDRFRARITDFGLSKMKSEMSSASSSKGMKGTLGWMAPELFTEEAKATTAADIYAFAMVLWEMMVNPYRVPFQGLAPASLISAKLARGDKQETIPETCPPKLAHLMRACWQEPDKRPPAKVLAKSLSVIFKSSQEQPSKASVQSQKDKVVQNDDLFTAAF